MFDESVTAVALAALPRASASLHLRRLWLLGLLAVEKRPSNGQRETPSVSHSAARQQYGQLTSTEPDRFP